MVCNGNDFQHQNEIVIIRERSNLTSTFFKPITKSNVLQSCIYLAVRKVITADWLNDRDQFLCPNDNWKLDTDFQKNCLVYALFTNAIQSQHGTNHWIPFTEEEVNAQERFESHFMSDYLAGKIQPEAPQQGNLFPTGSADVPSVTFGTLISASTTLGVRTSLSAITNNMSAPEVTADVDVRVPREDAPNNADEDVRAPRENAPNNADEDVRAPKEDAPKVWHSRGYLPHIENQRIQAITFRLADSVPTHAIEQWKTELQYQEDTNQQLLAVQLHEQIERYEDAGHGECLLSDPRVADIVQQALLFNDGKLYRLLHWCIMPNHVHVMIEKEPSQTLSDILKAWKSYTSHAINQLLGRTGSVWMPEYFDRYIRNEEHFYRATEYIRNNPVKAGLVSTPEEWKWSDAGNADVPSAVTSTAGTLFDNADVDVRVPREDAPNNADGDVRAPRRAVMDAGRELWRYYHAQPNANPNASFYDIRLYFQGTKTLPNGKVQMNTESNDATYTTLITNLRQRLKELAKAIEPKVYEYGFLKQ